MAKVMSKIFALFLLFILIVSGTSTSGLSNKFAEEQTVKSDVVGCSDNFYFVQITDTHVMHKLFDKNESSIKRFKSVIENVTNFENKPAFIVITGDLCEWGGNGVTGFLNCKTFVDCLYKNNNLLYADPGFSIPVYTTPGNHDHLCKNSFKKNSLRNYHFFIDGNHIVDCDRYVVKVNDLSLFFMDSGSNYILEPWKWLYVLGNGLFYDDILWLEEKLSTCETEHKIVLMHHPSVNIRNENNVMIEVIARNRVRFIELCENYDVELVLCGHTHTSMVFDSNEILYEKLSLNCSIYPTLFVQTDDCKQGVHYRNVSLINNDIWLGECKELV
jgi:3',5'-cyclic AMP phosphodiesterase CpdA